MQRAFHAWARVTLIGVLVGPTSIAFADKDESDAARISKRPATAPAPSDGAADNTKRNQRDRADGEPTADQSKNNKSDVNLAAQVRKAIVADKTLSTTGHNVKVIVQDGMVTLKGPVHSDAEKASIVQKAAAVVGQDKVTDNLEVKP